MKKNNILSIFSDDYQGLDNESINRIKDTYYDENYTKLRIGSVILIVCEIIYIIRDIIIGFNDITMITYINLYTSIIMIALSLMFLGFGMINRSEWSGSKTNRTLYNIYIWSLLAAFCMYTYINMAERNATVGVYICFLFAFVVIPFYEMRNQVILYVCALMFSFISYLLLIDDGLAGVIDPLIIIFISFISSCLLRTYYIRIKVSNEKALKLTGELIYRKNTDYLTDIPNRLCMYDDYEKAQRNSWQIGMVLYDIDDFKKYNDAYLHLAGDECLKKTSLAVKNFVEKNSGKLYRYGGEEFVVIFFGITKSKFEELAPQINTLIYDMKIPHAKSADYPYLSISSGGTYSFITSDTLESLLIRCDTALYEAKSNKKNCLVIK